MKHRDFITVSHHVKVFDELKNFEASRLRKTPRNLSKSDDEVVRIIRNNWGEIFSGEEAERIYHKRDKLTEFWGQRDRFRDVNKFVFGKDYSEY